MPLSPLGTSWRLFGPLYPAVSLEVIDGGFAKGMEDAEAEQLSEEATELALRLIKDLDIFGDKEQQNQDN